MGTTSQLVGRNVKVRTPHQICSEPNGLWQRGLQYKQRTLSLLGMLSWPDWCHCKECQLQISFYESPSRWQTVPVTSSCACKPVWYKEREPFRIPAPLWDVQIRNSHSPAIFLYWVNYSDFANYFLWWSRTFLLFCHRTGQYVRPAERDKVFLCVNLTGRLLIYPEKWPL